MDIIRHGAFRYGLYQKDCVPYILIEFGSFVFDFQINGFDLVPPSQRRRFKYYEGKACFTLVSPQSNKILVVRQFYFSTPYVARLVHCLEREWQNYQSEFEVDRVRGTISGSCDHRNI